MKITPELKQALDAVRRKVDRDLRTWDEAVKFAEKVRRVDQK